MRSLLLLCFALAAPAAAQEGMTGQEFDDYVTGRTITFSTINNPAYGIERYLPGQRVMWSNFEGTCQYGVWFESKGDICFRYEGNPISQCWTIFEDPDGLRGVYTTWPNTTVIYEVRDSGDALICNDLSS
ncbi:hypothetical protein [Roseobacter sp. CCS2]|uniref:hypothetical protein n=1 Tax=Roseobacter sp. CCS2 TaxID=391593 RepID=UPI0000F40512|nr:hypothetical protein [Roseobacter sp. CCS2]EBA12890.1 hypothetical protein RCCS2_03374 [Roseobacter sp. CCS2]